MTGTKSLPLEHFLSNGTYCRQIFLPAGIVVTGRIHNYDHTNIISVGDVTVMDTFTTMRIKGPATWVSPAGTKRLIRVHEDTIWTTVHKTELTDIEDIENELTQSSNLSWIKELGVL